MLPLIARHEEKAFLSYMREFNCLFSGEEYHFRLGIFLSNNRFIQEFNKQGHSYTLSHNRLSHLTDAEYNQLLGSHPNPPQNGGTYVEHGLNTPEEFDWRKKGVVNPIKDQAQCGSCWAFAVVQSQESAWAIKHTQLYTLSESNVVDCCTACFGCDGGWPDLTVNWAIKSQNGHFMLEADYPYIPVQITCKYDADKTYTTVTGMIEVRSGDEENLAGLIASFGVASACIDASGTSFRQYSTGIYDNPSCSSSRLDHAVGCVGFGAENGVKYWIVRNSWATDWGENGYIRMIRGKQNQCGIATSAFINQVA